MAAREEPQSEGGQPNGSSRRQRPAAPARKEIPGGGGGGARRGRSPNSEAADEERSARTEPPLCFDILNLSDKDPERGLVTNKTKDNSFALPLDRQSQLWVDKDGEEAAGTVTVQGVPDEGVESYDVRVTDRETRSCYSVTYRFPLRSHFCWRASLQRNGGMRLTLTMEVSNPTDRNVSVNKLIAHASGVNIELPHFSLEAGTTQEVTLHEEVCEARTVYLLDVEEERAAAALCFGLPQSYQFAEQGDFLVWAKLADDVLLSRPPLIVAYGQLAAEGAVCFLRDVDPATLKCEVKADAKTGGFFVGAEEAGEEAPKKARRDCCSTSEVWLLLPKAIRTPAFLPNDRAHDLLTTREGRKLVCLPLDESGKAELTIRKWSDTSRGSSGPPAGQ